MGDWVLLAQFFDLVIGFALTTTVFAMICKIMPRVSVKWRGVWLDAEFTWIYAKTFGSMRDLQPQLQAKTDAAAPSFATVGTLPP